MTGVMDAIYIDRNSQNILDWLRALLGEDGEYQRVLTAHREDSAIPPSSLMHVHIDLLIDKKDA